MYSRERVAFGTGVLVVATALAVVATRLASPGLGDPVIVRILLGILAVFYAGIALVYTVDGYPKQAAGHVLACVGFGVVAASGEGTAAWVGVALLAIGGGVLLLDAVRQGGQGRARA